MGHIPANAAQCLDIEIYRLRRRKHGYQIVMQHKILTEFSENKEKSGDCGPLADADLPRGKLERKLYVTAMRKSGVVG
jgi:hypothetical protein